MGSYPFDYSQFATPPFVDPQSPAPLSSPQQDWQTVPSTAFGQSPTAYQSFPETEAEKELIRQRMAREAAHPASVWRRALGDVVGKYSPALGNQIADPGGYQFRQQLGGAQALSAAELKEAQRRDVEAGIAEKYAVAGLYSQSRKSAVDTERINALKDQYKDAYPIPYQMDTPGEITPPELGSTPPGSLPALQSPEQPDVMSQAAATPPQPGTWSPAREALRPLTPLPTGTVRMPDAPPELKFLQPPGTVLVKDTPEGKALRDAKARADAQLAERKAGMIEISPDWASANAPMLMPDSDGKYRIPPTGISELIKPPQPKEPPAMSPEDLSVRAGGKMTRNPQVNALQPDEAMAALRRLQQPIQQGIFVPDNKGGYTFTAAKPGQPVPAGTMTAAGVNTMSTPTAASRTMAEMAQTVTTQVPTLLSEVDDLKNQIGPAVGRWNELWTNKAGLDDPAFAGLDQDLDLFASALVRTHFGARGGQQYREALKKNFSEAQSPDDLKARIQHADQWIQGYAQMATPAAQKAGAAPRTGPATPSIPPRPASIPAGAKAQYNLNNKQWRYSTDNGATWQTLKQ